MIKRSTTGKSLKFQSKLENIAEGMEYYAFSIPLKITQALGTKKAVPVAATVNNSEEFYASLFPVGGGRHYLRIRNKICKAVGIKKGDRIRVKITVRDRQSEIFIPRDLMAALRAEDLVETFKSLPVGKKSYMLRVIDEAARPETREKRIQAAVEETSLKKER